LKDESASYLDIAEFIQSYGANIKEDLRQLWRRIIFNIAVSNTDDQIRNHGFLLTRKGWILSPTYDINPYIAKDGLSLNIDIENNLLDFMLAKSVGDYFQLDKKQMNEIISGVIDAVKAWREETKLWEFHKTKYY